MDMFDAYEKFVKPEDDAMKQALIEESKKEEDKLWDDGTNGNDQPKETKTPEQSQTPPALTLSEDQMQKIIAGVIAGMKGGSDGDAGPGQHDAE